MQLSSIGRLPWLVSRLVANERKFLRQYRVPPTTLVKLWSKGYFSYAGVLYDLDRLDLYLSDVHQYRTHRINGAMGEALRNKFVCKRFLAEEFDEHLPETYGFVRNGEFVPANGVYSTFEEVIDDVDDVVCKPISGGRGTGIYAISGTGGEYRINSTPTTRRDVVEFGEGLDDYLIVDHIDQHEFEASVFPDSLNTIRVVTMVDPDTGDPFIGVAVHRFGVPESIPADNFSTGGLVAKVDERTGKLDRAASARRSSVEWQETHPTTGTRIRGESVPNWSGVRELVLSIAEEFGDIWPYVGWDVAISTDGTPIIIEGNRASDVNLLQIHEPVLADERNRQFYEHHGVI